MMDSLELKNYMGNFYGTEHWYRYMGFSKFLYTDGVKAFAENAEAYWFIDECFELVAKLPNDLYSIKLTVKDEKATIVVKGEKEVARKNIHYTDCPEGEWLFYFTDNVLLWKDEY